MIDTYYVMSLLRLKDILQNKPSSDIGDII